MSHFFVTGTGTGVGKTTVSCAVLGAARNRGLSVAACKPVESGCERLDGELWAEDAMRLREAGGAIQSPADVCSYMLELPLAPGVAAEREGCMFTLADVAEACHRVLRTKPDVCVVEGAGGLLVPLAGDQLIADLAVSLAIPVLLVGRTDLGTINHTLLSLEALDARGLTVSGLVLCDVTGLEPAAARSNAEQIQRFSAVEVLGALPYLPNASTQELAVAAEANLALDQLFHVKH